MTKTPIALRGHITLVHRDAEGNILNTLDKDNLIVNTGKNFVASAIVASSTSPFTHMAAGSSGTAPVATDTTLGTEIVRTAFTSASASTNVATMQTVYGPGVGTGVWAEGGIFNAGAGGTMFARVTFGPYTKNPADTITLTWQITAG